MKKIDGYRYVLYKNAQHRSWSYILIRLLPMWIISIVLVVLALQSCAHKHVPNNRSVDDPKRGYRNLLEPVKAHKPSIKH